MARGRHIYASRGLIEELDFYRKNCEVSQRNAQDVLLNDAFIGRTIRKTMVGILGTPSFFEIKKRKGDYGRP